MRLLKFSASVLLLSSTIFTFAPLSPLLANQMQNVLIVTGEGSESVPTTLTEAQLNPVHIETWSFLMVLYRAVTLIW